MREFEHKIEGDGRLEGVSLQCSTVSNQAERENDDDDNDKDDDGHCREK